jgi:hypothetical protein
LDILSLRFRSIEDSAMEFSRNGAIPLEVAQELAA